MSQTGRLLDKTRRPVWNGQVAFPASCSAMVRVFENGFLQALQTGGNRFNMVRTQLDAVGLCCSDPSFDDDVACSSSAV